MFENIELLQLQQYWWFIVALLGGFFTFMMFIQGGQTLLSKLGKTEEEKNLIIAVLGRKWELGFTTLVLFGGTLFAAFPLFYAVSFGGAYYVWMAILFCFIVQAVSYEYRKKPNNFFGQKIYETFLYINGSLGIFLIGVALATLFSGGNFIKDDMNLSHWTLSSYGLEALLNPFNLSFGLMVVFLSRVTASLYFINTMEHDIIIKRARKQLFVDVKFFLGFFFLFLIMLFLMSGLTYNSQGFTMVEHQFLWNLIQTPVLLTAFILGVALILYGIYTAMFKESTNSIWSTGIGTIIIGTTLLSLIGFNQTAIYPSLSDVKSSLTIVNSSGSYYTLLIMSYVSLMIPFVLGYIYLVWKAMDKTKITTEEVEADHHHY